MWQKKKRQEATCCSTFQRKNTGLLCMRGWCEWARVWSSFVNTSLPDCVRGTQCDMVSPNKLPSTYTPYIPWGETSVFSPTILFHTAKNLQPPTLESEMTGTVKISLAVLWSNVRLDPGLFLKGVTWRNKNKISTIPCVSETLFPAL